MSEPAENPASFWACSPEIIKIIGRQLNREERGKDLLAFALACKDNLAAVSLDLYRVVAWTLVEGATLYTNGFNNFIASPGSEFVNDLAAGMLSKIAKRSKKLVVTIFHDGRRPVIDFHMKYDDTGIGIDQLGRALGDLKWEGDGTRDDGWKRWKEGR
ncbi:hypothetical protein NCC49_006076 [Naganishia albida]|nr:hypothetical protein NCC49_006076 [Naganishia albida]